MPEHHNRYTAWRVAIWWNNHPECDQTGGSEDEKQALIGLLRSVQAAWRELDHRTRRRRRSPFADVSWALVGLIPVAIGPAKRHETTEDWELQQRYRIHVTVQGQRTLAVWTDYLARCNGGELAVVRNAERCFTEAMAA